MSKNYTSSLRDFIKKKKMEINERLAFKKKTPENQEKLDNLLKSAVYRQDLDSVDRYLKLGANPIAKHGTMLSMAINNRNESIFLKLLEYSPSLKENPPFVGYLVKSASYHGTPAMLSGLIEKGVNVRIDGDQALRDAVQNGKIENVKLLMRQGAKLEKISTIDLINTISNDHPKMIKFILTFKDQLNPNIDLNKLHQIAQSNKNESERILESEIKNPNSKNYKLPDFVL